LKLLVLHDRRCSPEGIAQRLPVAPVAVEEGAVPRTNVAAAFAVERAVGLLATRGRHHAESLLRIYGLERATVLRVLFEPQRRRLRGPGSA
jgi:hypothetical protein